MLCLDNRAPEAAVEEFVVLSPIKKYVSAAILVGDGGSVNGKIPATVAMPERSGCVFAFPPM